MPGRHLLFSSEDIMDLKDIASGRTLSAHDIVAAFSRQCPAFTIIPRKVEEIPPKHQSRAEEHLAQFLLEASRPPPFSAEETMRIAHHEASRKVIIVGELSQFPDRIERAVNDAMVRICKSETGDARFWILYILALVARLYRVADERRRLYVASHMAES
jgi:hypothetical protein